MSRYPWAAAFLAVAFLISSNTVQAAENNIPPDPSRTVVDAQMKKDPPKEGQNTGWPTLGQNAGPKCFDYYHFQSVQVSLGATKDAYKPGESITFKGNLTNQNDYPVIDGSVFARISRKNPGYMKEGNFIIDEITPLKKVALDAKEKQAQEFTWAVPQDTPTGDYRIDYFFSVGNRFSLSGLSFSNEVIIGTTNFKIADGSASWIYFDRSQTKVNDNKYAHIGNWPVVEQGKSIIVTQPLTNTLNESKEATITYDLFYWDSLDETDKISTKSETITLPAKGEKILTYAVDKMDKTVYYLRITAKSGTQQSIINLRFVSEGYSPRLNFPAITKFPVQKGESLALFSCYHNTSNQTGEGKVIVTLTDRENKEVSKTEYTGTIASNMAITKQDFTAQKDYGYLKLTAKVLDKDGKQIDSYETIYDCDKLNFGKCNQADIVKAIDQGKSVFGGRLPYLLAAALLLTGIIAIIIQKKRGSGKHFGMFLAVIMTAGMFGMAGGVEGYNEQSVAPSAPFQIVHQEYYWRSHWEPVVYGGPGLILQDGVMTVTHTVGMTSGNTAANVGDNINFAYGEPSMFFIASGGSWGSPYGYWKNTLGDSEYDLAKFDDSQYALTSTSTTGTNVTYWPSTEPVVLYEKAITTFTGVKPVIGTADSQVHMISSDPTVISCSGMNCAALKAGAVTLTANIPETLTRAWSKHQHNQGSDGWTTYWEWNHGSTYCYDSPIVGYGCSPVRTACVIPGSCQTQGDIGTNILTVPAAEISWDVTVIEPACKATNCTTRYKSSASTTYSGAAAACSSLVDPDTVYSSSFIEPTADNWASITSSPYLTNGTYWTYGPGITTGYEWETEGSGWTPPSSWDFYHSKWAPGEIWNPIWHDNSRPYLYRPKGPVFIKNDANYYIEDMPFCINCNSTYPAANDQKLPAVCEVCECDPAPTLTLSATPAAIGYGTAFTSSALTWNSNDMVVDGTCVATSVPADTSWNGSGKPRTNATDIAVSPTQTTAYTLTCNTTDAAQPTITSSATVTYTPNPCIVSTYDWVALPAFCNVGDNCKTKSGGYMCVDNCGGTALTSDLCTGPKPTENTKACPCSNRDNTYREVQP